MGDLYVRFLKQNIMPINNKQIAIVTSVIMLLFGGQLAYKLFWHFKSDGWVKTPAIVTDIEELNKSAKLSFEYTYNGRSHIGNRYQYISSGTLQQKREILERYNVGDKTSVFVNPSNPSQSVANKPALHFELFKTYFLLFAFLVPIALISFDQLYRTSRRSQPDPALSVKFEDKL